MLLNKLQMTAPYPAGVSLKDFGKRLGAIGLFYFACGAIGTAGVVLYCIVRVALRAIL